MEKMYFTSAAFCRVRDATASQNSSSSTERAASICAIHSAGADASLRPRPAIFLVMNPMLLAVIFTQLIFKEPVLKGLGISDYAFCAPVIEEGYDLLLRDDAERAKQCMQFIMKCVKEDRPVYFHCSLGRDRTGTVAMMVLGLLGVDEGEISKEYEILTESCLLDRAGSCIRIEASGMKNNAGIPARLQTVYIIPAADGSRVAAAHYTVESAEGFGRRFSYIMNTLSVIDRNGK